MGISNLTGKRLKSAKQSAESDHLLECNCSTDINSNIRRKQILIKESLLIKRDEPQSNKTIKSFPLRLLG